MATRKMKRYAAGDAVYEDDEPSLPSGRTQMSDPYEDAPEVNRARAIAEGEKISEGERVSSMPASEKPMAKPKANIVTKAELEKSGLSLRDYMNKQQGLTRRGSSTPAVAVASARDTGDELGRMMKRAPKPVLRQETFAEREKAKYDEGQRIMASKRAASAEADAASDRNRQSRILTGIKKKADENKFMGSTGLKKGGKVSSASRRADGIAIRGKTRA
jgi:hypothetical protein